MALDIDDSGHVLLLLFFEFLLTLFIICSYWDHRLATPLSSIPDSHLLTYSYSTRFMITNTILKDQSLITGACLLTHSTDAACDEGSYKNVACPSTMLLIHVVRSMHYRLVSATFLLHTAYLSNLQSGEAFGGSSTNNLLRLLLLALRRRLGPLEQYAQTCHIHVCILCGITLGRCTSPTVLVSRGQCKE